MTKKLTKAQRHIAYIIIMIALPLSAMCQKDTITWYEGRIFTREEYIAYSHLSERGKQITDSLYKKGIPYMDNTYMALEPAYMKPGKKIKTFWRDESGIIYIYLYMFFNSRTGHGFKFISRQPVN